MNVYAVSIYSPVQDTLIDAEERIEGLIKQKVDFESAMKDLEDRLLDEEDAAHELEAMKKKMDGEMNELKKDIEDLENSLAKVGNIWCAK